MRSLQTDVATLTIDTDAYDGQLVGAAVLKNGVPEGLVVAAEGIDGDEVSLSGNITVVADDIISFILLMPMLLQLIALFWTMQVVLSIMSRLLARV